MKYDIDKLNALLVVLSFIVALFFPFELFLLSYVVLGSLHYLTELIWLHKHTYFTHFSKNMNFLVILLFLSASLITFNYLQLKLEINWFSEPISSSISYLLMFCFFATWIILVVKKWQWRIVYLSLSLLISYFLQGYFVYTLLTILLATLIHVYVFTGLFMWNGIKKSQSAYAKITFYLFVLAPFLCVVIPNVCTYTSDSLIKEWYLYSGFDGLYQAIMYPFVDTYPEFDFQNTYVIKLQRFIAFAYTYHYLNWFSKVELIKWHHTTKKNLITVIVVWLCALSIYMYDFKTGFLVLYFFSLLHVVMEFPLNVRSIQQVFTVK